MTLKIILKRKQQFMFSEDIKYTKGASAPFFNFYSLLSVKF